jgi:hypothetical protein
MNDNPIPIFNAETAGQAVTTPLDTAGLTTPETQTERAVAGHGAPEPAMPVSHPVTSPAIASHSAPWPGMAVSEPTPTPSQTPPPRPVSGPATGYVTLDDVAIAFEQAGIMRARRTFQRYCETGMLQGQKFDTLNGPQYFVLESSVPRAIESVKALDMSRARQATAGERQPDTASPDPVAPPQHVAPAPSTQLDPAMARYVERLEHDLDRAEAENDNKTNIINSLIERDRETNSLTQGLQKLLTPLLGRYYGPDAAALDKQRDHPPDHP